MPNRLKRLKVFSDSLKVIPLKLFYYQTFFETWRNEHSWYEHYKNAIKIWGHRACLRVSRLLKWGIFTSCALKVRITFIQNKILVTWEAQSFALKEKLHLLTYTVLLHLSRFWLLGCGDITLFRTVPWLTWSPRLGQNTPSWKLFSKKNHVLLSNFFSSSNMFFIKLFLASTWNKNWG